MAVLPPAPTPLYHHPLPSLESWLQELGARQAHRHSPRWTLELPEWSAEIELGQAELGVSWLADGQRCQRRFSYGLTRQDVQAAILAGP
ncbi:MAG: hypothetical protein RLZZ624_1141 [Cyanobacteriota bacterium]|jgi:hypothetical protein